MIRFILVTFLFLGWAFYELSGGSTFEPEEPAMADATAISGGGAIEIVTRSTDPVLAPVSVPTRLTEPLIAAPEAPEAPEAEVTPVAAETPVVDDAAVEAVLEEVAADVDDIAAAVDLREVAGSRVNMRTGPGTSYNVVTTLDGGTRVEVIDTDPSGWVKLRVVSSGLEGWMAGRLLTSVDG